MNSHGKFYNWSQIVVFLALACWLAPSHALVPNMLSYQGYLTDPDGAPVNEVVNISFAIYTVSAGGTPQWTDSQSVNVSNGFFLVELGDAVNSFPIGLFDTPLYLGIAVGADSEMSPRQAITSVGFAFKADDADSLEGQSAESLDQSTHVDDMSTNPHAVTAVQVGALSGPELTIHAAEEAAHHVKTTSFLELMDMATDAQIPSTITRDTELGIHASEASAHHDKTTSLPWNDVTSKPAGFADNIDNDSGGDITAVNSGYGLNGGGTSGAVTLNVNVPFWLAGVGDTGIVRGSNLSGSIEGALATSIMGVSGRSGVASGRGVYGNATEDSTVTSGVYGRSESTAGRGVYGIATAATGYTRGVYGETVSTSGRGVYGRATASSGLTYGVYGSSASTSGRGVHGYASTGTGVYGSSTTGTAGYFQSLNGNGLVVAEGSTGLGTANPNSMLHVNGDGVIPSFRAQVAGSTKFIVASNGAVGIGGNLTTPAASLQVVGDSDATLSDGSGYAVIGLESSTNIVIDNNEIMARSNGAPSRLWLNRESSFVVVPGLEITGGADLVEPFNVHDEDSIQPGMVLAIDPGNPGKLRIADDDYDRTVAGVVSGANGISPGLSMSHQGTTADGTLPVALTGRLYALADAEYGAIQPGDLLTTSRTPGHVMKVTDYSRAHGSIIGKAMTKLDKGTGYVLVLVSLQ